MSKRLLEKEISFESPSLGSFVVRDEQAEPDENKEWLKRERKNLFAFDFDELVGNPSENVYALIGSRIDGEKAVPLVATFFSERPNNAETRFRWGSYLWFNAVNQAELDNPAVPVLAKIMRYVAWVKLGKPIFYSYVLLDGEGKFAVSCMPLMSRDAETITKTTAYQDYKSSGKNLTIIENSPEKILERLRKENLIEESLYQAVISIGSQISAERKE